VLKINFMIYNKLKYVKYEYSLSVTLLFVYYCYIYVPCFSEEDFVFL